MMKGIGRALICSLLLQPLFSTVITDSFLHQGLARDCVVFYTDTPVQTRIEQSPQRQAGEQVLVQVILSDIILRNKKLVQRLNNKEPQGYKLSCEYDQQNHTVSCRFTFLPGTMTVRIAQQENWHGIATIIIECQRTTPLAPLTLFSHDQPLIVLDAGHGGDQPGARGLFGLVEKDLTLLFCQKVRDCLRARGYQVLLTRTADYSVTLDERTSLANRYGAKLLLSFHCNYASNKQARGIETIYSTTHSHALAQFIHEQLAQLSSVAVVDRGVKQGLLQTLYGCECPAALLELFFLSNPEDARQLKDEKVQNLIVSCICKAVDQFVAE